MTAPKSAAPQLDLYPHGDPAVSPQARLVASDWFEERGMPWETAILRGDFNACLVHWQKAWREILKAYYDTHFPILDVPQLRVELLRKYAKAIVGTSAAAFVAKEDGETKNLGLVRKGDVLKPASWKGPARHARGNLFDAWGGTLWLTPYGVAYLT